MYFIWKVRLGQIPFREILDGMGIDLDTSLYPQCEDMTEWLGPCSRWVYGGKDFMEIFGTLVEEESKQGRYNSRCIAR